MTEQRIRMSLPEADLLLTNRTVRRPYPKSQGPLCGSSSMLIAQQINSKAGPTCSKGADRQCQSMAGAW